MSDEDLRLLAEEAADFATALESACVAFKMGIARIFGPKPEAKTDLPGSEDLLKLPWKSYKTKQDADPREPAWIFSNTKNAEALLATLKSKDGKAAIGTNTYQLQAQGKFISRKPVKK